MIFSEIQSNPGITNDILSDLFVILKNSLYRDVFFHIYFIENLKKPLLQYIKNWLRNHSYSFSSILGYSPWRSDWQFFEPLFVFSKFGRILFSIFFKVHMDDFDIPYLLEIAFNDKPLLQSSKILIFFT